MRTIMNVFCGLAITATTIPAAAIDAAVAKPGSAALSITTRPIAPVASSTGAGAVANWGGRGYRGYGRRGSLCYWLPRSCYLR